MVKVSVNLPEEDYAVLKGLAERRKISFTQALRQAIASEKLLDEVTQQGGKLVIERGRQRREVVLVR